MKPLTEGRLKAPPMPKCKPTKSEPDYKQMAIDLWQMLDDIDTYSDMAKSDDRFYRKLVEDKQEKRFNVMTSDGYNLFDLNGNKVE